MLKVAFTVVAAAMAIVAPAVAAQAIGPDAAACTSAAHPAVLINVSGFKAQTGRLRVQLYGPNPADFLAKGKYVRRVDLPVTAGRMPVCVAVPHPGRYAIAVRHDVNGDNKSHDWNDGGGFSRNPSLSMFHLKPSYDEVAIPVGGGVVSLNVLLNYRRGLSIGPLARG